MKENVLFQLKIRGAPEKFKNQPSKDSPFKLWFQALFLSKLGQRCRIICCVSFCSCFLSRVKISKEAQERSVVNIVNDPLSYVVI
jgi:hypothetical protein